MIATKIQFKILHFSDAIYFTSCGSDPSKRPHGLDIIELDSHWILLRFPFDSHSIHTQFTFNSLSIHIRSTLNSHSIPFRFTFDSLSIPIRFPFDSHLIPACVCANEEKLHFPNEIGIKVEYTLRVLYQNVCHN